MLMESPASLGLDGLKLFRGSRHGCRMRPSTRSLRTATKVPGRRFSISSFLYQQLRGFVEELSHSHINSFCRLSHTFYCQQVMSRCSDIVRARLTVLMLLPTKNPEIAPGILSALHSEVSLANHMPKDLTCANGYSRLPPARLHAAGSFSRPF